MRTPAAGSLSSLLTAPGTWEMSSSDRGAKRSLPGSEVRQQARERTGVFAVIGFPAGEVRDEELANLTRRILPGVGVEQFPVPQRFEIGQPYREEHPPFVPHLAPTG